MSSKKLKVSLKESAEVSNAEIKNFKDEVKNTDESHSPIIMKIISAASFVLSTYSIFKVIKNKAFK